MTVVTAIEVGVAKSVGVWEKIDVVKKLGMTRQELNRW